MRNGRLRRGKPHTGCSVCTEKDAPSRVDLREFFLKGQKPRFVRSVFDRIARRYDLLNNATSFGMHHLWRRAAVRLAELPSGGRALDVACGTGDFLPLLRGAVGEGGRVVGLDFSTEMLKVARDKMTSAGVNSELVEGDAEALPFEAQYFDAVTIGFALRNLASMERCFREMHRVLVPGGRVVALEIARPQWWPYRSLFLFYFEKILPVWARLLGGEPQAYRWLPASLAAFSSREGVTSLMRRAGFESVTVQNLALGAVCVFVGVKS